RCSQTGGADRRGRPLPRLADLRRLRQPDLSGPAARHPAHPGCRDVAEDGGLPGGGGRRGDPGPCGGRAHPARSAGGGLHGHRYRHDGGGRMMTSSQWTDRWRAVMSDNYGTPPIVIVRGQGASVWDADGREYLDMVAGIAVNALGHAHPAVQEAVATQMAQY